MIGGFLICLFFIRPPIPFNRILNNRKRSRFYIGNYGKGYTIDNTILVRLEDGNVALLYTVSNQFENDNVTHQSQVQLLVKMPYNSKKQ